MPFTMLSGFLGVGKIILLNRILNGDHGLCVAVLVNDFGSINIDTDLVIGVESDVISLANGCICCSIRDDLVEAVTQVIESPEKPEQMPLKPWQIGCADLQVLNKIDLAGRSQVERITAWLDEHFHRYR
jgi:G3E family GTPase